MKVISFDMTYKNLTTKNKNLDIQKILIECEFLTRFFVCKWGKTTRNGTKGRFKLVTEEEAFKRMEELRIETNNLIEFRKSHNI